MHKGMGGSAWWNQAAVALIYALGFIVLRQVSFSHWVLFAGFRLCALMLVPYRYWPALLLGELGPLAYTGFSHAGEFGWPWTVAIMIPPIGLAMPVVRWCRERLGLFASPDAVNMGGMLLCTLLVSIIWTLSNLSVLAVLRLPPDYPTVNVASVAARWFIGNYLGVLTVTPLVLMTWDFLRSTPPGKLRSRIRQSRMPLEFASVLLPALAILVWVGLGAAGAGAQQIARMGMFLPVVWLSLRHGWKGAALGGSAASVAVVLTMPAVSDPNTVQAEVFIAFAITTMLLLGERIAVLKQGEQQGRDQARMALALAQRNVFLGEMQLRQTSYALEHVREGVQSTFGQLLGRLRHLLPALDEREYRLRAAVTQHQLFRLADSMHPIMWREDGLVAALRGGSVARGLDEAGIRYWCDVREKDVADLSISVQIALYRLACEAIASHVAQRNVSGIRLRLRAGEQDGRRWAVLSIDGTADPDLVTRVHWDDLLLRLSSSGLGMEAIQDRVAIFEGRVKVRPRAQGQRISMMLLDPES